MKPERPLFDQNDPEADAAADARAEADIVAGRGVPHANVVKWMRSWGTAEERPVPPEWLR